MSIETCRKIKAVLFIALLCVAEASHVQQYTRFNSGSSWQSRGSASSGAHDWDLEAMRADLNAQSTNQMGVITVDPKQQILHEQAELITKQLEAMVADRSLHEQAKLVGKHVEAMLADPSWQRQEKAMLADPSWQQQEKAFARQMNAIMADANLREQAELVAKPIEAMLTDLTLQEQANRVAKQMEAMMANPNSQKQAKLVTEQVKAMKANPKFREQVKRVAEQMKVMKINQNLQEQVERAAGQIKAMKADPNFQLKLTRVAEQMEAMSSDPKLQEQAKRIFKQMEVAMADLNLHEQVKVAPQIKGTKMGPNFQEQAKGLSLLMEAMKTDPILPAFDDYAHGDKQAAKHVAVVQDSTDVMLDSFVDRFANKLFDRAHDATPVHAYLDNAALGKDAGALLNAPRAALQPRISPRFTSPVGQTSIASLPSFSPQVRLRPFDLSTTKLKSSLQAPRLSSVSVNAFEKEEPAQTQHPARPATPRGMLDLLKGWPSKMVLTSVLITCALLGSSSPAFASSFSGLVDKASVAGDSSGFLQAFLLIFLSEIGDKTFFIAGLLAAKYSRIISFSGSIGALAAMTVIATVIGQIFHNIPEGFTQGIPFDDYVAVAAFTYFGAKSLYDAYLLPAGESSGIEEERKDAEEAVEKVSTAEEEKSTLVANIVKSFGLVFVAEIGDRSFLSTIALSAALNPIAVAVGAIFAHAAATGVAVVGGDFISQYLSEKVISYISGGLFLVFAITTAFGLF